MNAITINGLTTATRDMDHRPLAPDNPKFYRTVFPGYQGLSEYFRANFPESIDGYSEAVRTYIPGPPICSPGEFALIAADVLTLIETSGLSPIPLVEEETAYIAEGEIGFGGYCGPYYAGEFRFSTIPRHSDVLTRPYRTEYSALTGACHIALAHQLGPDRASPHAEEGCWGPAAGLYRMTFPDRQLPEALSCAHSWDASLASDHDWLRSG